MPSCMCVKCNHYLLLPFPYRFYNIDINIAIIESKIHHELNKKHHDFRKISVLNHARRVFQSQRIAFYI